MDQVLLKIKKLGDVETPKKQTRGSIGFDLQVFFDKIDPTLQSLTLKAGQVYWLNSRLAIEIPEKYAMDILPRSSTGIKKGITLSNTVGVIDSDFRNEFIFHIKVDKDIEIQKGERLFQGVVRPNYDVQIVESDELSDTSRLGGIGSTGS